MKSSIHYLKFAPMGKKRPLFLGLGSNQGDRLGMLTTAKQALQCQLGPLIVESQIYETGAWGIKDQSDFLNQVIVLACEQLPERVLRQVLTQENLMGRQRTEKWGPRTIDIDLLFYGDLIHESEDLTLPHPFISQRKFILAPLAAITPEFVHPVLNKSMNELLHTCPDESPVNLYGI